MLYEQVPDQCLLMDACLTGCGAAWNNQFYRSKFPVNILQEKHHISRLELLNIMVALKVWCTNFAGKKLRLYCDNSAAVYLLQTGKSRDSFMLACAREIWYLAALHDFIVQAEHRPGAEMELADSLSRSHLTKHFQAKCDSLLQSGFRELHVDPKLFNFSFII